MNCTQAGKSQKGPNVNVIFYLQAAGLLQIFLSFISVIVSDNVAAAQSGCIYQSGSL